MKKVFLVLSLAILFTFATLSQCQAANESKELVKAAGKGDLAKVQLLLEGGADVNATANFPLWGDLSALMKASERGYYNVAKYLIENGADVNYRSEKARVTALMLANTFPSIVKLLLDNGAKTDFRDMYGMTALMYACAAGSGKNQQTVELLLKAGANPNIEDNIGHTALWYAQANGKSQAAQMIRQYGGIITNP